MDRVGEGGGVGGTKWRGLWGKGAVGRVCRSSFLAGGRNRAGGPEGRLELNAGCRSPALGIPASPQWRLSDEGLWGRGRCGPEIWRVQGCVYPRVPQRDATTGRLPRSLSGKLRGFPSSVFAGGVIGSGNWGSCGFLRPSWVCDGFRRVVPGQGLLGIAAQAYWLLTGAPGPRSSVRIIVRQGAHQMCVIRCV